jgi:hypothetical protein
MLRKVEHEDVIASHFQELDSTNGAQEEGLSSEE